MAHSDSQPLRGSQGTPGLSGRLQGPQEPPQGILERIAARSCIYVTDRERRIVAAALDLAIALFEGDGGDLSYHRALRARFDVDTRTIGDLTRPQELAADAMASKHGRSAVRRLADGAVEIIGMIDDIELETVCIEIDGRERWRR